ncbi:hypothetical protein RUND412_001958 [Rhizina undulata]
MDYMNFDFPDNDLEALLRYKPAPHPNCLDLTVTSPGGTNNGTVQTVTMFPTGIGMAPAVFESTAGVKG